MQALYFIVPTMLAAGLLGGAVNYFLSDPPAAPPAKKTPEPKKKAGEAKPGEAAGEPSPAAPEKRLEWWQHLFIGVSAAFAVPVFLNMISSDLIAEITGNINDSKNLSKLLVLDGFCLLAAISSRAFLRSLSDKLLEQVKETKKQAKEAKETAAAAKQEVATKTEKIGELEDSLQEVKGGVQNATLLAKIAQDAPKVETAPKREAMAMGAGDAGPKPGTAPNDPWKGVFGMSAVDKDLGRELKAKVIPILSEPDWYGIELSVEALAGSAPLEDEVQFFLHDAFPNSKPRVKPVNNKATLYLKGWGAFTVGALTDKGTCKLELDLSELAGVDEVFRSR